VRKIFEHNFVPYHDLKTQTIDGKRHYVLPSGEKFKSVTTVLSEKLDKTALIEWKKRVGPEEAQRVSSQATRRGTAVHKIAERYILNEENYTDGIMPIHIDTFRTLKPVIDNGVNNLLGVEIPLYSKALKAAGRADLVALYNGVPAVLDFKTSKRPKKLEWIEQYILQSTCYSMMFESMYKIHVPKIVILIAVDDEPPQVFELERAEYVNRVIELFTV
jgi:hypothetical protein